MTENATYVPVQLRPEPIVNIVVGMVHVRLHVPLQDAHLQSVNVFQDGQDPNAN